MDDEIKKLLAEIRELARSICDKIDGKFKDKSHE